VRTTERIINWPNESRTLRIKARDAAGRRLESSKDADVLRGELSREENDSQEREPF